ncbi:MAG: OmpA family protein [Polyangiaceae bacterium]|nr:OmpA family protein [Polyangiaceae bacterium]
MFRSSLLFASGAMLLECLSFTMPAAAQAAGAQASPPPPVPATGPLGRPTENYFDVGVLGGLFFPAKHHALARANYQKFDSPVPEVGVRISYFPIAYAALEVEGAAGPTKVASGSRAGIWSQRLHALVQLPNEPITPFVVLGAGLLGAGSNPTGTNQDPAFHFGAGAKWALDDFVGLRLDVRDNLSQKHAAAKGSQTHHPEVQLGLNFTLDLRSPPKAPVPPPDADQDGFVDASDKCPTQAGVAPDGCPPPPDSDGDGVIDPRDACPSQAGEAPTGCPNLDADHDCVPLPVDVCPTEAGIAPNGCPDPDPDRDGVQGTADTCPNEAETKNGYQDGDGCADTLPEAVKKYSGVIPGIEFDLASAKIRPVSKAVLDGALAVLKEYGDLRVEISGHTDNVGDHDKNLELSKQRAEAVKAYFTEQGIDAARIEARGAGPDEPLADNKDAAGRQKNRRIEFKLLSK